MRQAAIIFEAGERWQEAADLFGQLLEIIVSAHGDKPELTSFAKEGLARALGELDG